MELLSLEQIVMFIFGAGGIGSSVLFLHRTVNKLSNKIDYVNNNIQNSVADTNKKVHNLEISLAKTDTKLDLMTSQFNKFIEEMKAVRYK